MSETAKKVIVGMSGGVDSSVSAWLLQQQGYQVEGLFMKNWEEDDGEEYCTAAADLADAQAVCDKLGIELHTVNFAAEYWDNVLVFDPPANSFTQQSMKDEIKELEWRMNVEVDPRLEEIDEP